MVPVVDNNNIPLMPCSEKRARKLMEKEQAKPMWKNQIFYIKLIKEPSDRNYQDVTIGIDSGSKREALTITTNSQVVLNILVEAKQDVKDKVETRGNLRRARRGRNMPYRKCRFNRKIGGIPPSTLARWNNKLRLVELCRRMLPITVVNVEDVCAKTMKNGRKWNVMFSPLEVGKEWFYSELRGIGLRLHTTKGFETSEWRNLRGFQKTKKKLEDVWESHCVDSHSLCEISIGGEIDPFKGMYKFEQFNFHRRQLHVQNFSKGHIRKEYGSTVSLGVPRGTLGKHSKFGLVYIGGSSKGRLSLHSLEGKRLTQNAKKEDVKLICVLKWRTLFLPNLTDGVSKRKTR
jgi:hypothetical protein